MWFVCLVELADVLSMHFINEYKFIGVTCYQMDSKSFFFSSKIRPVFDWFAPLPHYNLHHLINQLQAGKC